MKLPPPPLHRHRLKTFRKMKSIDTFSPMMDHRLMKMVFHFLGLSYSIQINVDHNLDCLLLRPLLPNVDSQQQEIIFFVHHPNNLKTYFSNKLNLSYRAWIGHCTTPSNCFRCTCSSRFSSSSIKTSCWCCFIRRCRLIIMQFKIS